MPPSASATAASSARAKQPKSRKKASVKPQDILAMADDIAQNVLMERAKEMGIIVRGSLAGVNVHQLGPPGTGKSLGLREYASRIVGANYFEKAVHAQMPADALVGGYDMPRFAQTGEFARNVEGYLPWSHVANVDEITRANGPTLDALLPLFNTEERRYEANGGMKRSEILFFVTASNFMPDPDDPQLGALVDRFTLMQYVEYVKADDSFKEMFRRHHARRLEEMQGTSDPVTITLEQFVAAQQAVTEVRPTPEFLDKYAELRRDARTEGLHVSDRRWMELGRVARATAWLSGRDFLVPDDLASIESGLWRERDEIPIAHKLCMPFQGRFEQLANKHRQESSKTIAALEEMRPVVEGTPPSEKLPDETVREALNAGRALKDVYERTQSALKEAEKEQREAPQLRELANEIRAWQEWMKANGLPANI